MESKQTSLPVHAKRLRQGEEPTQKEMRRIMTEGVAEPYLAAARVVLAAEKSSGFGEDIDPAELGRCLEGQADAVNRGDMTQVASMLMLQATALQTIFARLIERGMAHDQIPGFETNMRIALRAQNQCRATLETLATIKNPPVIFARQANITNGPQQINNGVLNLEPEPSQAREIEIEQTQLLSADHGERLDIGTTSKAIGSDPEMATLGKLNRTEVRRG